ncbi:MAG TPA: thioesterase family protein [Magnetospirillaceae bacterium]|jgi:acyl-CoA thioester hydrolase
MSAEVADERLRAAFYRHWIEDRVRYRDLDALSHLNSAVYSTYFETARVILLRAAGMPLVGDCDPFALVRQTIDYRRELMLDTPVRIGTRITKLGRTSVGMTAAIFDGDTCVATAEIIGVILDRQTRRPKELSEDLRQKLSAYL